MRFRVSVAFAATAALSMALVVAGPATAVGGRLITVTPTGVGTPTNDPATPEEFCSLTPTYSGPAGLALAVNNAQAGDTIKVCNAGPDIAGTYLLTQPLNITVPLTLIRDQTNSLRPTLSGSGVSRVINVAVAYNNAAADVLINGFNIIDGKISTTSHIDCRVSANCGAGIQLESGNLAVANSQFTNNQAAISGGAIAVVNTTSTAKIIVGNSNFENNSAGIDGAAIYVSPTATARVVNNYFVNNTSTAGAVIAGEGTLNLNFSTVVENIAPTGVVSGAGLAATNNIIGQRLETSPLCSADVTLLTGNLVTDSSCAGAVVWSTGLKNSSAVVAFVDLHLGRYLGDDEDLPQMRLTAGSVAINYLTTLPTGDNLVGGDANGTSRNVPNDRTPDPGADEWLDTSISFNSIKSRTVDRKLDYGTTNVDMLSLTGGPISTLSSLRETLVAVGMNPAGTITYASLSPAVCTIGIDATLTMLGVGKCFIETYRAGAYLDGDLYEEYVGALTLNVVAIDVPSTPRTITAVAGDRKFTISWLSPISDGGAAMRDYTVIAEPQNGGATASKVCTTSPCVVTGVTNEAEYLIKITATNSAGKYRTYSRAGIIKPILPTKPSAPTLVRAITAKKQVTLTWDYPETWSKNDNSKSKNAVIIRLYLQTAAKKVVRTVTIPFVGTGKYPLRNVIKKLTTGKKMIARLFIKSKAGESPASKDVKFTVK
ncbi:MAG: hypothetical protein RLZZ426_191 [Actinomycetota bacterium]